MTIPDLSNKHIQKDLIISNQLKKRLEINLLFYNQIKGFNDVKLISDEINDNPSSVNLPHPLIFNDVILVRYEIGKKIVILEQLEIFNDFILINNDTKENPSSDKSLH